jgi:hypothetical protein
MMELYKDADYLELTLKCLFVDAGVLQRAKDLGMTPEDFGTINIYRAFAAAALSIGQGPINSNLALAQIKTVLKEHNVQKTDLGDVVKLWEYVYDPEPVNATYVKQHLVELLKARRFLQLKADKFESPEELVAASRDLLEGLNAKDGASVTTVYKPFKELVFKETRDTMGTGFPAIDATAGGLSLQQYGMIFGHSGSGKTAMAIFGALQNALKGHRVLYLSLEEPAEDVVQRFYANIHRLPYTKLHHGDPLTQADLREAHDNTTDPMRLAAIAALSDNLAIVNMRDVPTVNANYLKSFLDQYYAETGWAPELVYIDQLDYLDTNEKLKIERWETFERISFEMDELCNHLIGGEHMFALWLLHQASGGLRRKYTNADIAGCKGVIKPVDIAFAIGKDEAKDTVVTIFSLKCRHSKNFQYDYLAELEFMNFIEKGPGDDDIAEKQEADTKAYKGKGKSKEPAKRSSYANIPPSRLPSNTSGFTSTQ